ncbi:MAG: sugar phosphate isomerase/epimerase, partial [Gemmatimonadaceae bacterium]|nr:sugar phosphate isomerase/epimerase [Gemmatimonadaceae bacterium]
PGSSAMHLRGVGIQMYMMRDEMRADLDASLARVARLGYEEVEWWGTWGRTPAQLRTLLDGIGLRVPTSHVGSDALEPAALDATLDNAATMGIHTVIVAGMGRGYADDADGWKRAAQLLSTAGAKAAPLGIRIGYHNHDREFRKHGAMSALEILIKESDAASVDFQLDCYWAFKGGADPLAFLKAHKDRIAHLHLKDAAAAAPHAQVDLGKGVIDWKGLISTGLAQRVVTVTLDMDDPADAWASAGSCRSYLRGLGY